MNANQLRKLGVPEASLKTAIGAIQKAVSGKAMKGREAKKRIALLIDNPDSFLGDPHFGDLAKSVVEERDFVFPEPIDYRTWGDEIDENTHAQMRQACAVPNAAGAALMPDAHLGYGLPIGGVLALENAVIPYAVGVDIACRMKLSVLDTPVDSMTKRFEDYKTALEQGTRFGVGKEHDRKQHHDVMDRDWSITAVTRKKKETAWKQLGTSGSGNHFVEFGQLTLTERDDDLGLDAGTYVALMSHSGSRGAGAAVCSHYSGLAQARLPKRYEELGRLAWLEMDSEEGQEYWAAMNLMGEYAAANHAVIHRLVSKNLGAEVIAGVENHHNFSWLEHHGGRDLYVHRKGATPAGKGVLGVIPGSMADPAFIVRGEGHPESFDSASHGAGRKMSRNKAKDKYNFKTVKNDLAKRGITVLSAGADEVPGAYKDIQTVMNQQQDLVDIIARFDPKIVKMADR